MILSRKNVKFIPIFYRKTKRSANKKAKEYLLCFFHSDMRDTPHHKQVIVKRKRLDWSATPWISVL